MKLDLYLYYKKYYQRSNQNPNDENITQMKNISHQIAFLIHKNRNKIDDRIINQAIELADELLFIENIYNNFTKFSLHIIEALKKRNFKVDIPHPIAHRWNFNSDCSAYIYVAISESRKGESKLGVTTMSPEIRAKKYSSKYGYHIKIYDYVEAMNPYEIEAKITNELSNIRVSKNTEGDSIEWYRIDPNEMFDIVKIKINKI